MAIDFGITSDVIKKIGEILAKIFGNISIEIKINICSNNNNSTNTFNTLSIIKDATKIDNIDKAIKQSFKISDDEYTMWLHCSTHKNSERIALGMYLMYSCKYGEELPLWIGVQATKENPELNLSIVLFFKERWEPVLKNKNGKWKDDTCVLHIANLNEKTSEELLSDLARELNDLFAEV